jgi:signal transduction histidine kinase
MSSMRIKGAKPPNAAKFEFLADLGHELRTPLNAILGFSRLLETDGNASLRQAEYAGYIREAGEHLLRVVDNILDLARIDAGNLELHEEAGIDPRRLCDQCIRLVENEATAAGLRLSVAIAGDVPPLLADRTRLTESLLNLLSNAIKFSDRGGEVGLAVRRSPHGEVLFDVRDTGSGLTREEIEIALQPFARLGRGHDRRSGAGLGLPLARRFAELHGGSLSLASVKGSGTTATIVLPARRAATAGSRPPETPL